MSSVWPSDDHIESSDDELGEQSMSIILPTLCAWCVLQGRGALQEDTVRCDEATNGFYVISYLCWCANYQNEGFALTGYHMLSLGG